MSKLKQFLSQCCVVDYEGTGLDFKTAEVIEIGVACRDGQNDKGDSKWEVQSELCKPIEPISPFISSITNITNRTVIHAKGFETISDSYKELLDAYPHLIAHNSFYESKLSKRLMEIDEKKWICTLRLSKYVLQKESPESLSLPFLRYYLDLDVPDDLIPHRAGNDAWMTACLFEVLLQKLCDRGEINDDEDVFPQLEDLLSRPIIYEVMTFGKHKGQPMSEVPIDYLKWVILNSKQVDETAEEYDPDLAATIEKYYLEKTGG